MEELMKETKAGADCACVRNGAEEEIRPAQEQESKEMDEDCRLPSVVIAAVAAGCMARASKKANAYLGGSYLVAQATRQDLTLSVTGTATLKPADSYNVTTLISGEIENAPFELGDLVDKGDLLFALNSSDAQNNVDRAKISVAQAQNGLSAGQGGAEPHGFHQRHDSASCMSTTATA